MPELDTLSFLAGSLQRVLLVLVYIPLAIFAIGIISAIFTVSAMELFLRSLINKIVLARFLERKEDKATWHDSTRVSHNELADFLGISSKILVRLHYRQICAQISNSLRNAAVDETKSEDDYFKAEMTADYPIHRPCPNSRRMLFLFQNLYTSTDEFKSLKIISSGIAESALSGVDALHSEFAVQTRSTIIFMLVFFWMYVISLTVWSFWGNYISIADYQSILLYLIATPLTSLCGAVIGMQFYFWIERLFIIG